MKTREKKKKKGKKDKNNCLATSDNKRRENAQHPLDTFWSPTASLQLFFPAGCNCSPLKKKEERVQLRQSGEKKKKREKTTKPSIASTPSGLLINSSAASDHLTRCAYSRQMPPAISLQPNFIHQCSSQRLLLHDTNHFTLRLRGVRIKSKRQYVRRVTFC